LQKITGGFVSRIASFPQVSLTAAWLSFLSTVISLILFLNPRATGEGLLKKLTEAVPVPLGVLVAVPFALVTSMLVISLFLQERYARKAKEEAERLTAVMSEQLNLSRSELGAANARLAKSEAAREVFVSLERRIVGKLLTRSLNQGELVDKLGLGQFNSQDNQAVLAAVSKLAQEGVVVSEGTSADSYKLNPAATAAWAKRFAESSKDSRQPG
jgi:hypothetical protein